MVKSTFVMLSTVAFVASVLAQDSLPKAPKISVPDNFLLEAKIYLVKEDGTLYDTLTTSRQIYDSDGNRARQDVLSKD